MTLPFRNIRLELRTALVLFAGAVSLAVIIGNIGFQGDDWWEFSFPFWGSPLQSFLEYAHESRRPIEGIYAVLSFKLFGLNRVYYTLCALLFSAGACLVLCVVLKRAFPERKALAALSAVFAFVFPSVSHLIYMFHTDNSRLSSLFFWISVFAFQRWAMTSRSKLGLFVPLSLYWLATLTYENTTFLIFTVPLFVWPIWVRCKEEAIQAQADPSRACVDRVRLEDPSHRQFLIRLCGGVVGGFFAFLFMRFLIFSGGAVGHKSLVPSFELVYSYFSAFLFYCAAPFQNLSTDGTAWVWGAAFAGLSGLLLLGAVKEESRPHADSQEAIHGASDSAETTRGSYWKTSGWEQSSPYIALVGIAVFLFGVIPYMLAGYNPEPAFTSQARVFSSASFGLPILLALAATIRPTRMVGSVVAVICIFLMAVFLAGLRGDWQAAAERRNALCADLLRQVPDVAPGTTFLFLDLQSYISRDGTGRAVVFQGVDGLERFVPMLYGKKNVYGYFLYPEDPSEARKEGRTAEVSPLGLAARGSVIRQLIPLDSVLIFKRSGTKMVLLDKISSDDALAVHWNGVNSLHSNRNLIKKDPGPSCRLTLSSTGALEVKTSLSPNAERH